MSFMRTRAARSVQQGLRASVARPMVQGRTQFVARRYASSGGHGKEGSDLPWLISALAITPVGTYFLWPSGESGHHGHDEHHEEHHEEAEAKEEEPKEEEKPQEESDEAKESGETSKPSGTEGDSQPKADDANKKSSGNEETEERAPTSGPASTEGVQGKGQMSNESEGQNQGSKREPDGKGAFKNRKDSGLSKDLSTDPEKVYAEDGKTEAGSPSKPGFSQADTTKQGEITAKQQGMSNTPTRHSIPIHESDEKSKKPEGGPDTAKSMGTIDPSRPQK